MTPIRCTHLASLQKLFFTFFAFSIYSLLEATTVNLHLLVQVDVAATSSSGSPQFIGNNPSAVAWNGSTAWLGGYNASGGVANTAIVPVTNVVSSPTIGNAFGAFSTNNLRGITGLSVQGNNLAAALDNGAGSGDSVRLFNATSGALQWRIGDATAGNDSSRRGNGTDFDPGFNGAGSNQGVAYLANGSGRRHLLNTATGVYINGQNVGAIINFSPTSTTWRDLAFDPATGDLYTRESNRVGKAVRNGDNTFVGSASTVLVANTTATAIDNQNIEFLDVSATDRFVIFNDRSTTGSSQPWTNVIKAATTTGTAVTITYSNFNPTSLPGNGAYDFSYDSASQTLAISDFANRQLYIFAVPEPGSAWGLLCALLLGLRARRP